jgi:hypothetical protein
VRFVIDESKTILARSTGYRDASEMPLMSGRQSSIKLLRPAKQQAKSLAVLLPHKLSLIQQGQRMQTKAREYIDFWIENSVHAAEQYGTPGASQDVNELVGSLIEGAKGQGISEEAMMREVGDLAEYVRDKLAAANQAERDRRK